MKKMLSVILIIVMALAFTIIFGSCNKSTYDEGYVMPYAETRIDIGLGYEFTVVHTSDTHLTMAKTGDTRLARGLSKSRKGYFDHQEEKLDYVAKFARENGYPIVHTGDLIDYISKANLEKASSFLKDEGNDILMFTSGNHEFCTDIGDPDDDTPEYRNKSLDKINDMSPFDVRFHSVLRNGVIFIGIDDSYHEIDKEQLEALKKLESEAQTPIVLVMHAPLYEEGLFDLMMNTGADSAYLLAVPEEKMTSYSEERKTMQRADETTQEAYDFITSSTKIRAVLAGHVHRVYKSSVTPTLYQSVVDTNVFEVVTFY